MLKTIFDIFIYLLAVYGALSLFISVVNSIFYRTNEGNTRARLVLVVKNQEETIEGIIRNIFTGDFLRKLMCSKKLTVLDLGSTDQTHDILMKLKGDYECLEILNESEKESILR